MKAKLNHTGLEDYTRTLGHGALQGAAYGGLVSLGVYAFMRRRGYLPHLKSGVVQNIMFGSPLVIGAITLAELRANKIEREQKGIDVSNIQRVEDAPDSFTKLKNFLVSHKYRLIVSGWAAAMAGSFALVNRDKYMSKAQKIVQARVYAQGITVALLLMSVLLSIKPSETKSQEIQEAREQASHSWEHSLPFVQEANHHKIQA